MRNKKFYLTTVLPILLSVVAAVVIVLLNSSSILHTRAATRVANEKGAMRAGISDMKNEQKELRREEAEYDKVIEDNQKLIGEVESLRQELESYNTDINRGAEKNSGLDASLADKQTYLDSLNDIQPETEGGTRKLKEGTYKSPADLPAGKYRAEGSGKLYLKDISNRQKDKADLATTDTHSYVFEIAEGESIKTEGDITLTALTDSE